MSANLFATEWMIAPRPAPVTVPSPRPWPGHRWCRVFATPTETHRELGGLDAVLSLHERANAWCTRAIALLKADAAPGHLAAVRYLEGHLAVFVRVAGPDDAAFLLREFGPFDTHVDVTYVDQPRLMTMQERAAWDECGRLGFDAANRGAIPWQMLCQPHAMRWIVNVAQSGGWLPGAGITNGGALNGRLDADDSAPILLEMVRLGWLERSASVDSWVHVEDVAFCSFRETPLLRQLLGFAERPDGWVALHARKGKK